MTESSNLVSTVAMDFAGLTALSVVTNAVPDALPAISDPPSGFTPGGWPGRVHLHLGGDDIFRWAFEVQIGRAELLTNGLVQVKARLVIHPTPLQGGESSAFEEPDSLVFLQVTHPSGSVTNVSGTSTDSMVVFTYQPEAQAGRDYLVAYCDLYADSTAWAWTEFHHGTTVRFGRRPDVADDRRLNNGTLRLVSNSSSGVTARVLPVTNNVVRPAIPGDDYDLKALDGTLLNLTTNGWWELLIPSGSTNADFRLVPRDNTTRHLAEYEAAWFRIQTNASYAVVSPEADATALADGNVAVTLWDGAKYRITPLDDHYYFDCGGGESSLSSVEGGGAELESEVPAVSPEETVEMLAEAVAGTRPATDPTLQALARAGLLPEETVQELGILPSAPGPDEEAAPAPEPILTRIPDTGFEETLWAEWQEQEALGLNSVPPLESQGLLELSFGSDGFAVQSSTGCSLDAAWIQAFGINQTNAWRVAGYTHYYNNSYGGLPQEFQLGGYWLGSALDDMVAVNYPWEGWTEMLAAADDGACAGVQLSGYYYRPVRKASGVTTWLPELGYGGEAPSIGPGDQRIAGWCREYVTGVGYRYRAIRWDRSGSTWNRVRLGDFAGNTSTNSTIHAYAYGINDSGNAVGKCQTNDLGYLGYRAFRTGGDQAIDSASGLRLAPLPSDPVAPTNRNNFVSSANGINRTFEAVGGSDTWFKRGGTYVKESRAVLWPTNNTTGPLMLGYIEPTVASSLAPGRSELLAVNSRLFGATAVGWGWATPTGYVRACVADVEIKGVDHYGGRFLNLNDPQLSWSTDSGISLTSAEAINDAGVIVANGSWSGHGVWQWGFVLEPQPVADQ